MKQLLMGAAALALVACGGDAEVDTVTAEVDAPVAEAPAATAPTLTLADTVANSRRDADRARDQFRNPVETLEFFGLTDDNVKPGMRVAEIWPGYYTDIIAPYLAERDAQFVAVLFPAGVNERLDARIAAYRDKYADADTFGDIDIQSFSGDAGLSLEDGSVDMILTFRNVHNWMGGGYAEKAFAEFARALKPGGTLGVVEHRLPETRTQDPKARSGYVQESYMKALAAEAGLEFVGASEVNANPLDTADHPMGVWTLPPRSRVPEAGTEEAKDFDAELYRNIGESDRATLLFRKPAG